MRHLGVCLCIVVLAIQLSEGARTCVPYTCRRQRHCPALPDDCEWVTWPCRCCGACARRVGEPCSARTPKCASGLMCMNARGEALEQVPRIMRTYHGICQNVVVQPVVVENLDIEERIIGSRHYKDGV